MLIVGLNAQLRLTYGAQAHTQNHGQRVLFEENWSFPRHRDNFGHLEQIVRIISALHQFVNWNHIIFGTNFLCLSRDICNALYLILIQSISSAENRFIISWSLETSNGLSLPIRILTDHHFSQTCARLTPHRRHQVLRKRQLQPT